jgi:hypothetical protein
MQVNSRDMMPSALVAVDRIRMLQMLTACVDVVDVMRQGRTCMNVEPRMSTTPRPMTFHALSFTRLLIWDNHGLADDNGWILSASTVLCLVANSGSSVEAVT